MCVHVIEGARQNGGVLAVRKKSLQDADCNRRRNGAVQTNRHSQQCSGAQWRELFLAPTQREFHARQHVREVSAKRRLFDSLNSLSCLHEFRFGFVSCLAHSFITVLRNCGVLGGEIQGLAGAVRRS